MSDKSLGQQVKEAEIDLAERRKRLDRHEKNNNEGKIALYQASVKAGEANLALLEERLAEEHRDIELQIQAAEELIKSLRQSIREK